jgi:hypothetical protein
MKRIIKQRIDYLSKQKNVRQYKVTHQGLLKIINLKPRTQQLLADMLALIGSTTSVEGVTFEVSCDHLGFSNFSNFSKYRNELLAEKLLFYKDNLYFVNPCFINYLTRRQQSFLFSYFGLNKANKVLMTDPALRVVFK